MAITRAQQAKQMLQNGGMLVSPSEDGKRPGYRGDAAYRSYSAQSTGSQRGTATKSEIGGGKAQPFDAPLKNDPRVPQSVKDSKGGITKAQSDAAKDFKALQQFKVNMNKTNYNRNFNPYGHSNKINKNNNINKGNNGSTRPNKTRTNQKKKR